MCAICGGSVCAGTGACTVIVQNAPEVVRITYTSSINLIGTLQASLLSLFSSTKEAVLTILKR